MSKSFDGKRVVTIGASLGIGLVAAELLDEAGAEPILANRNIDALRKAADNLSNSVQTRRVDVSVEERCRAFL